MIQQLNSTDTWDICIIGGGATGLGTAIDAASRGFKTILFEKYDFAKGTSSRSTKLVHGGVRYLQQGNIKLVLEALQERGLLLKNAPHLVHNQQFIVPNYKWWEKPFYGIGLKIYDRMAGKLGLGSSQFLSAAETLSLAPTLDPAGLKGGVLYHDGQFDDARLAIHLAQTAVAHDATVLNYFEVTAFIKSNEKLQAVEVTDRHSGKTYRVKSKAVINATGVFTDLLLQLDQPNHENIITASQGIHLIVDKEFLPGETAIMIPRTDDKRVLFAVPWHNKIVLGTTDTPIDRILDEPVALQEEIEFILSHIGRYLTRQPGTIDIRSVFAGLRPLVKGKTKKTAALSRDHLITVSRSGLITVTGGKWTTYRKMAEDVIDLAIDLHGLSKNQCITRNLMIAGHDKSVFPASINGLSKTELRALVERAVREEMCMTIEDFLSRRTRQLLLDARFAIESAPLIASLLAAQLNRDQAWVNQQINTFTTLATNYLPPIGNNKQ